MTTEPYKCGYLDLRSEFVILSYLHLNNCVGTLATILNFASPKYLYFLLILSVFNINWIITERHSEYSCVAPSPQDPLNVGLKSVAQVESQVSPQPLLGQFCL